MSVTAEWKCRWPVVFGYDYAQDGSGGVVMEDKAAIRETVENWVVWRDAGDWERFATVWHPDGWMTATWFQGPAADFIEVSRAGFEQGVNILHFLGGHSAEVRGNRAIAQTKMMILQRAELDGIEVDVTCQGRFYDFFQRHKGSWKIVRRQPIYEKDWLSTVDGRVGPTLDQVSLSRFPDGYRHLGYLQTRIGFDVRTDLPGLTGEAVRGLYTEGAEWLAGSPTPGTGYR